MKNLIRTGLKAAPVLKRQYFSSLLSTENYIAETKEELTLPPIPNNMLQLLDNKKKATVVIIGGRSQLGEELRRRFAASGWNVVCTTKGEKNSKKEERDYHIVGDVDLGDKVSVKKKYWNCVFDSIEQEQGPIHAVINCAGIAIATPKYTIDDINRRPVKPMLEACIDKGISRYVYISSKAAAVESAREPGSYAATKYDAEQDIFSIQDKGKTKVTIFRPDLLVSANNPGQFGGPQMMSASNFKFTIGVDARKAGEISLSPVTTTDLAHAIINISERDIDTPEVINASGPQKYTMSELLDFFKKQTGKEFLMEIQLPIDALYPIAAVFPYGAFEKNHLDLAKHHTDARTDNKVFARLVGNPLITLEEEFASVNRPVFGDPNISGYAWNLVRKITITEIPPVIAGCLAIAATSRVNSDPHREERTPEDGINTGVVLLGLVGAALAVKKIHSEKEKDKKTPIDKILAKGPALSRVDALAKDEGSVREV